MNPIFKIAAIIFLFLHAGLNAQDVLVTEVTGIKALQGDLYLSIYDSDSSWMKTDSAFRKVKVSVKEKKERIILRHLPEGDYAIAIYQDLNENNILDETEIKIPKEPFGFSNNPKGIRGPATFQHALFHFKGPDTLTIKLINNIFTPNKIKNEKQK